MPWSGGNYSLPRSMVSDDSAGIPILASNFDEQFNDIRDGIDACIHAGGQNSPSVDIPMGGNGLLNVRVAVNPTDVPRADQIQQNDMVFARATTSTSSNYGLGLTPTVSAAALQDGFGVFFVASASNASAPTLTVSGITARPITYANNEALGAGDIQPNQVYHVIYNASTDAWQLPNLVRANDTQSGLVELTTSAEMSAGGVSGAALDGIVHGNIINVESSVSVSGSPGSVQYILTRHGRHVNLQVEGFTATADAGGLALADSIVIAGTRPNDTVAHTIQVLVSVSTWQAGRCFVTIAGVVGFQPNVADPNETWTASGVKGWPTAFTMNWITSA